ncbi:APC family permease [Elongatibacter sediminis]|uniref:Arginine/agmatine antiporter n=1 Tax=Elongatibacter sediminis TaxID=3119006 RepID=A0AAW9RCN3_9GAMM
MTAPRQPASEHAIDAGLKREISRLGFAAMSLNGVIGAGIFALPAVAAQAGLLFSPWLFLICGALIMTVVLSFSRAASFFSHTGGPLAYVGHAFGPFAGFQIGWLFTFSRITAMAANANLLVTYAAWFWEPLGDGLARRAAVSVFIVFLMVVNMIGVRRGVLAMFVFTLLKLIPLSLLVLLGLSQINPEVFVHPGGPEMDGIGGTLLVLMYAFVGFESAVVPAGEARDPRRDIPRALALSVMGITLLYVVIQIVTVSILPDAASSERPLIDVMDLLMGTTGAALMAAGAVFSITGNLSSMMLSGPRMVFAMSRMGSLPAWFGRVHSRWATPTNAIVFIGATGLALALSGSFIWLAAMSTVVRLIVYATCILALPRLEARADADEAPFHLPGGYLIPLAGLATSCWLVWHASLRSWVVTGIFFALGAVFYVMGRRRRGETN